jgi:type II secretory pathway pseudopilin PulG
MSTAILLLATATLHAVSQETRSAYIDKAENTALVDLCSQKWFSDAHSDKCQGVKAEVELRQKQQEDARQRVQADAELKLKQQQQEQEQRAQENMPKNGKVIVEFSGIGTDGYSAVLRPVGGKKTFVVYCTATDGNQDTNPYCKQLKKAKTYGVARLTEESAKTYDVGPQVFGTLRVKDPSGAANAEITYAVVGGNVARDVLSEWDLAERDQKRRAALLSLGLHSGQSQSRVKLLLQQQGFAPWRCGTDWSGIQCVAARQRRGSGQDEITVIFRSVTQRDEDTGAPHVVGRVLAAIGYTPFGESDPITAGPGPF